MAAGGDASTHAGLDSLRQQAFGALQAGRFDAVEAACRQILALRRSDFEALQLLAIVTRARGRLSEAESFMREAVSVNEGEPRAHNTLGLILFEQGRIAEAAGCYERSLAIDPRYARAHCNLGNARLASGQGEQAVACYRRAIELEPQYIDAHFNLGNARRTLGDRDAAAACYRHCTELDPRFLPAHTNLGALLYETGHIDRAIELSRRALAIDPNCAEAQSNLGSFLLAQGRTEEAADNLRRALDAQPQNPEAHHGLASLHHARGDAADAEAELQEALRLQPQHPGALTLLAQLRRDAGKWAEAINLLERASRADPGHLPALSQLLSLYEQTCQWAAFHDAAGRLDKASEREGTLHFPAEPPLINVARSDDPARNLAIAAAWGEAIDRRMAAARRALDFRHRRPAAGPLRIGYLSQDFRDHPVGHLVRGLFAAHDRTALEVHGYSYGPDDRSFYRRTIAEGCDSFVDIRDLSFEAAARRIHEDEVDILVDLTGHTKNNRLEICALRPAPVQASFLGFPGGTGAPFIDYLLTDPIVTPPEHAPYYSEQLAILPHCYQANDRDQPIAEPAPPRADLGLEEDAFVFVCFNQTYKIEPLMFDVWMRVLAAVPDSLLWLFDKTGGLAAENLKREAASRGIDAGRLVFAERRPKAQHLARLQRADLALDTRIYNGHTTNSDALWAGVPVVALRGRHFASRVSASLLSAVGLPGLIVDDLERYEHLAVRLARQREELRDIRARLWRNRLTEPLFDTALFARHLERAYHTMWETHLAGRPASGFQVRASPGEVRG